MTHSTKETKDMVGFDPFTLLDKIKISEEILRKASKAIRNSFDTRQLEVMSAKRANMYNELLDLTGIDTEAHHLSQGERLKLTMNKIAIDFESLLIHRNEREVLSFCHKSEMELKEQIEADIEGNLVPPTVKELLSEYLDQFITELHWINDTREAYHFSNH